MLLTVVEHAGGSPEEPSLAALSLARELAEAETEAASPPVEAVVFGPEGAAAADRLGEHGVTTVHHVRNDRLRPYAPDAWAESLDRLVDTLDPAAVLAPGTDRGTELLARLGAKRELPVATNVVDAEPGELYELERERWGGSLTEHAALSAPTALLTAADHAFEPAPVAEPADPSVIEHEPELPESAFRVQVDRVEEADSEGVPLGEARVVVGGGRGVGDADGYEPLEELAGLLDGTVGASRAAVNEGWRPHDDQIGQTGAEISPELYVACGISGAVQHMVGCRGADTILAVNTDPEAAIMGRADYAVEGDLHEVVPALNEALRERH
jgi:electron transfer flavoprotein alpha subunit